VPTPTRRHLLHHRLEQRSPEGGKARINGVCQREGGGKKKEGIGKRLDRSRYQGAAPQAILSRGALPKLVKVGLDVLKTALSKRAIESCDRYRCQSPPMQGRLSQKANVKKEGRRKVQSFTQKEVMKEDALSCLGRRLLKGERGCRQGNQELRSGKMPSG